MTLSSELRNSSAKTSKKLRNEFICKLRILFSVGFYCAVMRLFDVIQSLRLVSFIAAIHPIFTKIRCSSARFSRKVLFEIAFYILILFKLKQQMVKQNATIIFNVTLH